MESCVTGAVDRLTRGLAHLTVAWARTAAESPFAFALELLGGRACDSAPAHELVTEAGTTMIRSVPDIGFLGPLRDPELAPVLRDLVGLGFLEPR